MKTPPDLRRSVPAPLAVFLLASCLSSGCTPAAGTIASRLPSVSDLAARLGSAGSTPAASASAGGPALRSMNCRYNLHGIQEKVLVVERDARCTEGPAGAPAAAQPLRWFRPYFVFDVRPTEPDPRSYLIGATPRRDSLVGWIPAAAVAPWPTRVGVRAVPPTGRRAAPLLIYATREAWEEQLRTGTTRQEPLARAQFRAGARTLMPWPVAESAEIEVNGQTHDLVRICFLGELRKGDNVLDDVGARSIRPAPYTTEQVQRIRSGVKMLDIIFVVDNTHSTQPFIEAIRQTVLQIVRQLQTLDFKPDLNVGLVLYRDWVPAIMYGGESGKSVIWELPLSGDLDRFVKTVEPLREAAESSEDYAEAGYDGLLAGVTRTAWRGEGLSARVVVLIGDNSLHEPGHPKNPAGIGLQKLAAEAAARRVKVFSLRIDGIGDPAERDLHARQFQEIAAACGGGGFALQDASKVVERVATILQTETVTVHTRSIVVEKLAAGATPGQIASEGQLDIRKVTDVLELLQTAGYDPARLASGLPAFATGWAMCDRDGVPVLDREVFVARAELDLLIGALNWLCAEMSANFGERAFRTGMSDRMDPGLLAPFADGSAQMPLDVFLMSKGIPAGRTSLLRLTRNEIVNMPEADRLKLRERIARNLVPRLIEVRNDDALWSFLDDTEVGWIREELLP